MPTTEPRPIEIHALSKTYRVGFWLNRSVQALQRLELTVEPGQVYGLLGPNGAGKSTTIKILMNLVRPTEGDARLFGRAPQEAEVRRRVGFVPENPAPYEYLTGREFVTLAGRLAGLSGRDLDRRVTEVLGQVEMDSAERLHIRRYSKGMVQRIALAQALVTQPPLLILDEPTSGLDPVGRRQIRDLILSERQRGTTILFCTHIISDAEALCDRLAVLVGGRRVKEGRVADLLSSNGTSVEVVIEALAPERVQALGVALESVQPLDGRVLVNVDQEHSQQLIAAVLGAGGRVNRLQPSRFSLEQLFISALHEAGRTKSVGGEINV